MKYWLGKAISRADAAVTSVACYEWGSSGDTLSGIAYLLIGLIVVAMLEVVFEDRIDK